MSTIPTSTALIAALAIFVMSSNWLTVIWHDRSLRVGALAGYALVILFNAFFLVAVLEGVHP